MITSQISLLALILVGGIGILLIGVSALMKAAARKKAKACTAVTMGTVIDHRFMGEGRMYPVLEYAVDGTQYRAKKQFRGIKTKSLSGLPIRTQATAYEDAKGWLHVQTGPIARLGTLAEQLWLHFPNKNASASSDTASVPRLPARRLPWRLCCLF